MVAAVVLLTERLLWSRTDLMNFDYILCWSQLVAFLAPGLVKETKPVHDIQFLVGFLLLGAAFAFSALLGLKIDRGLWWLRRFLIIGALKVTVIPVRLRWKSWECSRRHERFGNLVGLAGRRFIASGIGWVYTRSFIVSSRGAQSVRNFILDAADPWSHRWQC